MKSLQFQISISFINQVGFFKVEYYIKLRKSKFEYRKMRDGRENYSIKG
jgi:hypothetical protein